MIVNRETMAAWVVEALRSLGGRGEIIDICKYVWHTHGEEIKNSGDMFYKWQYEIRWAGDILRKKGVIKPTDQTLKGVWELAEFAS